MSLQSRKSLLLRQQVCCVRAAYQSVLVIGFMMKKASSTMKRLAIALSAILGIFALTNCQRDNLVGSETITSSIPFEFTASLQTKTSNNGLSTNWVAGDTVNVFHAVAGTSSSVNDGKFTISSDNLDAGKFTGALSQALVAATSYDWYVMYPYSSHLTTPANTSFYAVVGSKHNGTQSQVGNDNMAHIAGANYPLFGKVSSVDASAPLTVNLSQLSSLLKIVVTNTLSEAIAVDKVSFATETEDIVGTYFINYSTEPISYTGSGDKYVSNVANLDVSEVSIAPNATGTFYIGIKPFVAHTGDELTVSVVSGSNTYNHKITLSKDVTFSAGKIKTVNAQVSSLNLYVDYVTLPWSIDGTGGKDAWTAVGLSSNGLGSNYASSNSPYLTRLDNTGDYVQVKFDSPAKSVTFAVKKIGGEGESSISVQGSADGETFTEIQKFALTGAQDAIATYTTNADINESYRYVRLEFTKVSNVGLGKVEILPSATDPIIRADNVLGISARGESAGELLYEIINPANGTTLSYTCDGAIVTDVIEGTEPNTLLYEVSANTTTSSRTGSITLTYGSLTKTISVSQDAPAFSSTKTEVTLGAAEGANTSITITSDFDWTAGAFLPDGATVATGYTITPMTFTWNGTNNGKQSIKITASGANASESGTATLGKIIITSAVTNQSLEIVVKQESSYVGPVLSGETTINFGSATGSFKFNEVSSTFKDELNNTWTGTAVGTNSFSQNPAYSQVGSSSSPASSITLEVNLPEGVKLTELEGKFGGNKSTAGAISFSLDGTTLKTGALNASTDVVVTYQNASGQAGTNVKISITNIAKGVKIYYIRYSYE